MVASGQKVLGLEADGRGSCQQLALVAAGMMAPVAQAAVVGTAGSRKRVWCLEGAGDRHKVQKVEAAGSSEQSGQGKETASMRRVQWLEAVGTRRGLGWLVWLEAAGSRSVVYKGLESAG